MADKWFFCEACAIYKTHARAFSGRSLDVEYSCLACGHRVRLVDRPCEHEWGAGGLAMVVREENQTHVRQCKKCKVLQFGAFVWGDA